MIRVHFDTLTVGHRYSRPDLANLWGYRSYHAIARGVVTPWHGGVIVLFVTEEKQEGMEPYSDALMGDMLHWEGPTDHFGEDRMVNAKLGEDEIHVFHRARHHDLFTYLGRAEVQRVVRHTSRPSQFELALVDANP